MKLLATKLFSPYKTLTRCSSQLTCVLRCACPAVTVPAMHFPHPTYAAHQNRTKAWQNIVTSVLQNILTSLYNFWVPRQREPNPSPSMCPQTFCFHSNSCRQSFSNKIPFQIVQVGPHFGMPATKPCWCASQGLSPPHDQTPWLQRSGDTRCLCVL